jgi:hypothetical protein
MMKNTNPAPMPNQNGSFSRGISPKLTTQFLGSAIAPRYSSRASPAQIDRGKP